MSRAKAIACLLAAALAGCSPTSRALRLPAVGDTFIQIYDKGPSQPEAAQGEIGGYGAYMLLKFDLKPLKGRTIKRARLHLFPIAGRLNDVGLSTPSTDWRETRETRYGQADLRDGQPAHWAGAGTSILDASFGRGNAPYRFSKAVKDPAGWYVIDVPPELLAPQVVGARFGLMVFDETWYPVGRIESCVVSSRTGGNAPYLTVELAEAVDTTPPAGIDKIEVVRDLPRDGMIRLRWTAPGDDGVAGRATAYEVKLTKGGKAIGQYVPAPTHQVPTPAPAGAVQEMTLEDLQPGADYVVFMRAVDEAGNAAMFAAEATASKTDKGRLGDFAAGFPAFAKAQAATRPAPPGGKTPGVWAIYDTAKINPVTGNSIDDGPETYKAAKPTGTHRQANPVWDAATRTVRLAGARNEFVAFQVVAEDAGKGLRGLRIQASDLTGPSPFPARKNVELFRAWYLEHEKQWYPEVLVPLAAWTDALEAGNVIPGRTNATCWADVYIPKDVKPGEYRGTLTVTLPGPAAAETINLELTVWDFTLPDEESFILSLNGYENISGPNGVPAGSPEHMEWELKTHRLAHQHRATVNDLPYNRQGAVKGSFGVPVEGKGPAVRVKDWSGYDAHFGKFLDGSAFKDLPRAGVPVSHLYLPFNERWPANIYDHCKTGLTWMDDPLDEEFVAANVALIGQFMDHFRQKGWTRTQFQFYLNNNINMAGSMRFGRARLDEPKYGSDYMAMAALFRVYKQGLTAENTRGLRVVLRADIGRNELMRDYLDGLLSLDVGSGGVLRNPRMNRWRKETFGQGLWNYGTAPRIWLPGVNCRAWCWQAYLLHADGVMPWKYCSSAEDWVKARSDTLVYPGRPRGLAEPAASIRLKMFRRGVQDMEYLHLLARAGGAPRYWVQRQIDPMIRLAGRRYETSETDAGEVEFDNLREDAFEAVRHYVAARLAELAAGGK